MLHKAIARKSPDDVRALLATGKISQIYRDTVLELVASESGSGEIVSALLDSGDVVSEHCGNTAIYMATSSGKLENVRLLLGNAPFSEGGIKRALMKADDEGHANIAQLLQTSLATLK